MIVIVNSPHHLIRLGILFFSGWRMYGSSAIRQFVLLCHYLVVHATGSGDCNCEFATLFDSYRCPFSLSVARVLYFDVI
jgi:hypothetical protein